MAGRRSGGALSARLHPKPTRARKRSRPTATGESWCDTGLLTAASPGSLHARIGCSHRLAQ